MKSNNHKTVFPSDSKGKSIVGVSQNLNTSSYSKANNTTTFLNSTQLRNISNSEPIEVTPAEVYFRGIRTKFDKESEENENIPTSNREIPL